MRGLTIYQDLLVLPDTDANQLFTIPRSGFGLRDGADTTITVTYVGGAGEQLADIVFIKGKHYG